MNGRRNIKGTAANKWFEVLKQPHTFLLEDYGENGRVRYMEVHQIPKERACFEGITKSRIVGRITLKTFKELESALISDDGHAFEFARCPDCGGDLTFCEKRYYCFNAPCMFQPTDRETALKKIRERAHIWEQRYLAQA